VSITTDVDQWAPWTLDEYARRLIVRRFPVHRHDGVWWQQVKPQFCWPLDLLACIPESGVAPAAHCSLFGYQFVVATQAGATSYMNPMVCGDVATYGLERMEGTRRNVVRRGVRSVEVRPLTRDELVRDGWQIKVEFNRRTGWGRPLPREKWQAGVDRQFQEPVIDHSLGAFLGGRLVSFMTWYGADRSAHLTHIAASDEALRCSANDALLYFWMCGVRDSGFYDRAGYSVRSLKPSLDLFKDSHLFRMQSLPARLHLNPLARTFLRASKPAALERLAGLSSEGTRDWLQKGKLARPSAHRQS
jgi:hypothetical protein